MSIDDLNFLLQVAHDNWPMVRVLIRIAAALVSTPPQTPLTAVHAPREKSSRFLVRNPVLMREVREFAFVAARTIAEELTDSDS